MMQVLINFEPATGKMSVERTVDPATANILLDMAKQLLLRQPFPQANGLAVAPANLLNRLPKAEPH